MATTVLFEFALIAITITMESVEAMTMAIGSVLVLKEAMELVLIG